MKYIILLICSIILPVFSLKQTIPKLCINCKFFTNSDKTDTRYSKCSFFPTQDSSVNFLITGVETIDYYYCSTARNSDRMCGKEGKKYKKKLRE